MGKLILVAVLMALTLQAKADDIECLLGGSETLTIDTNEQTLRHQDGIFASPVMMHFFDDTREEGKFVFEATVNGKTVAGEAKVENSVAGPFANVTFSMGGYLPHHYCKVTKIPKLNF